MWNNFSYDIKFDLVVIFLCLGLAAIIGVYLIAKTVYCAKRDCREIKVLQEPGEYSIEPDKDGAASFVLILNGRAKKITLTKRGE